MPRKARKNLKTQFLHVIVQGVNKEYIFYKDEYIIKYLEIMSRKMKDYNFEIIAYCVMNNHAHFLVYAKDISEFGCFMHKVNLIYAQMYNREEKRVGVLFRNRYQTEPIYNEKYLINCIKYIHNTPVKAGMVEKCEDYLYSSYNDYLNNVGVSQNNIVKKIFGNNCNYISKLNNAFEKKFKDIDDDTSKEMENYILCGIVEFCKLNHIQISDIFIYRNVLKNVIYYLKNICEIKYVEITKFFEFSRGTMDKLKIK